MEAKKEAQSRRGGVRNRLQSQAHRPPLPSMLLANVQSLENKLDDLRARIKFQRDIRDCNILCLSETWLTSLVPDTLVTPAEHFSVFRIDRTEKSGKTRGGGVCFMTNNNWCSPKGTKILSSSCSPHLEHLTIMCRPIFLPNEFTSVISTAVYIPPQANTDKALSVLHDVTIGLQTRHPDAALIMAGNFNKANLKKVLPNFVQHIKCPTRKDKTLDHCYMPFKNPFISQLSGIRSHCHFADPGIQTEDDARAGSDAREDDVRRELKRVKTRKAAGPDRISGRFIRTCVDLLAPVFTTMSPLLYSLYTHDCATRHNSNTIVKFADDTVVVGPITNNDERAYLQEVSDLTTWCKDNSLLLNGKNTKEMVVDFCPQRRRSYTPLLIDGTPVERVSSFKYLGVHFSEDFSWAVHTDTVVKKARQRLYHLRQLRRFKVSQRILKSFYSAAIQSTLTGAISLWYVEELPSPEKVSANIQVFTQGPVPTKSPEQRKEVLNNLGLQDLDLDGCEVSDQWKDRLLHLIVKYELVFSKDKMDCGEATDFIHKIHLVDERPFRLPYRRVPPTQYKKLRTALNEMEEKGIIRKSH
ncbi:hypothetical protein F2P81_018528 [Scophthalmus maximus]|uniref:Alkylated DNA repair protein AlkB homologue 8 N-terminal domain-containing protein n=1 Tax=Scophthalmus maximus TaxID=52904 RepID=A0A6A4S4Z7_SCOMX|nr:hypothetical protein F2P81_018528 [Scophthalmus maximus]